MAQCKNENRMVCSFFVYRSHETTKCTREHPPSGVMSLSRPTAPTRQFHPRRLVPDVMRRVLDFIIPEDLVNFSQTCRDWRSVSDATPTWRMLMESMFPSCVVQILGEGECSTRDEFLLLFRALLAANSLATAVSSHPNC